MADSRDHYWEQVSNDNQHVYRGLVSKIKFSIAAAVIVIAFLLYIAA